jgi:geranylgeranyl diphosphate synthase type I
MQSIEIYRRKVEKELELFFADKLSKAEDLNPVSKEMIMLLRDYTLRGGKRIRAALLFYGYLCFSDKSLEKVLKASLSMELLQSFLLIHDDVIDRDNLRRNGPTIHYSYSQIGKKRYNLDNNLHFGNSAAILVGDLACSFAIEAILTLDINPKYKLKALEELSKSVRKVLHGELLDVTSNFTEISTKDLSTIHELKTAAYSIEGPLKIGALLTGANERQTKPLSNYAIPLGKAYQLQDDILGLFGDEKEIGKPVGSDIKEGKKTLLILKALEKASNNQKNTINRLLGKQNISKKEISQLKKIVKDTGSLDYSKELIQKLAKKSIKEIKKADIRENARKFLIDFANYLISREDLAKILGQD